jgi:hypothetical protein
VPTELTGGFSLVDVFAVGEGGGSSLHMLYSDGLYTLSIYQQEGTLDRSKVRERGAVPTSLEGADVLRWPGTEPATYLWTGDGMTFTAVSEAPPDAVAAAIEVLPNDPPRSLLERARRGVVRLVDAVRPGR